LEVKELIREIISLEKSALYDELYYEKARKELIRLIKERALYRGEFLLSSGKKSSYYLDLRRITLDADAAAIIGYLVLYRAFNLSSSFDGVAGPTLGADPVVAAAVTMAPFFDLNLKGLIVRKEKKEHGLGKLVEGPLHSVKKVVVVEDVVTTGSSLLRACRVLIQEGVKVISAIPLVDRQEEELVLSFEELGIKFDPIITVNELL